MTRRNPPASILVRGALAICLAAVGAAVPGTGSAQQTYDVVIRNGRILDGTGNPWYYADVAVRGDRIAAIGDLSTAAGAVELDAAGMYVAPGFIDVHTHAGGGLATPELSAGRPLVAQGITTVVINPDGGGATNIAEQRGELLADGLGVNVAQMVPHGSVRRRVMGMSDRPASPAELDEMRAIVRSGMEEGAFGLSTGPWYAPGSFATTEELVALAKIAAEYGGAYSSHIRDEADYNIGLIGALDEVIEISRQARIRAVATHLKALGPRVWGFSGALVSRIERARAEGLEVFADQYPYNAAATSLSGALVPRWALAGGDTALLRRMDDPRDGPRLRAELVESLDRRGGADRLQFRRHEPDPSIEGRTLQWVADRDGVSAVEAVISLLRAGSASVVSFNMHDDDVELLMRQPWMMTGSDGDLVPMGEGVPHPRSYGTYPRKIREYVVEREVIDLASAIRSMTSLPATVFRIPERGQLRSGMIADIVVFDLARFNDPAVFTDPHQLAEGVEHLLVNGRPAIRGGGIEDELHGRVLSLPSRRPAGN